MIKRVKCHLIECTLSQMWGGVEGGVEGVEGFEVYMKEFR